MPHSLILHQAIHRLEADCRHALARVQAARTMPEVVRAAHIVMRPEIRALARSQPGYRRLAHQTEQRLELLLRKHLDAIDAAAPETARALRGRYASQEWTALRGAYGRLLRRAEDESRRLLHQKQHPVPQVPAAASADAPHDPDVADTPPRPRG